MLAESSEAYFWQEQNRKKPSGTNGQKETELYKEDEADGLHPSWYENGNQRAKTITTISVWEQHRNLETWS